MTVVLDSKDLQALDAEYAAESQVWEVLKGGAAAVTDSDFVGAKEVRINVMKGFAATDYKRGEDNDTKSIEVEKETLKLNNERYMSYAVDELDSEENQAATVENIVREHTRLVAIPEKDKVAVKNLTNNAAKVVEESITAANALKAFDKAEEYFTDEEIGGPFVMFVSTDTYAALKNAEGVAKTFSTDNVMNVNGINRKVAMLDEVPVIKVAKSRLQTVDGKVVNFIMAPINVAAPIEKYNTIDYIPASADTKGYRNFVKGLNYFDLVVTEKAKKAIYLSEGPANVPTV